jgi:hypothetical protein
MTIIQRAMERLASRGKRAGYQVTKYIPPKADPTSEYLEFLRGDKWTLTRIWAVNKPSKNPGGSGNEFGVGRHMFNELIIASGDYKEMRGLENTNETKLVFYVDSIDDFMLIPLNEAIEKSRIFFGDRIHHGGTVFLKVGDCRGIGVNEP